MIPVDKEKKPSVYWKAFQFKRAALKEILGWYTQFAGMNIGIVTGDISRLAVVDLDDLKLLPELKEKIPEITETARVRTRRGYHFYFSLEHGRVKSTDSLFGKKLELKSNGRYIVAPPSVIRNHRYSFEVPLARILPLPKRLNTGKALAGGNNNDEQKRKTLFKIPKYHGRKIACIRQILNRELIKGERNNSLFILYNLLLQNKNSKDYAQDIVKRKNQSLINPLAETELKKIYHRIYYYGCSAIREKLFYIKCQRCSYRFKKGQFKEDNLLIRNIRILPELTNTQRGIACLLGTVFEGEYPSLNKIAQTAKMNFNTVKKAIEVLKKKNIIDDSFYT